LIKKNEQIIILSKPYPMKRFYYLGILTLASCASSQLFLYNKDDFKKTETLKIYMNLDGYSTQNKNLFNSPDYSFATTFLHTRSETGIKTTTFILSLKTAIDPKKLSPELYIVTDIDTIHVSGSNYFEKIFDVTNTTVSNQSPDNKTTNQEVTTKTTTSPVQFMEYTYQIDDKEARNIANSKQFKFRVYLGDIGIDIIPRDDRKDEISYFFKKTQVPSGYLGKINYQNW
jgi:hypothetical protein